MTPYFVTIGLVLVLAAFAQSVPRAAGPELSEGSASNSRPARNWAILAGLVLAAVSMFRWRVGTDYGTYVSLYPTYKAMPLNELSFFGEPGIRIVAKLSAASRDDATTMFAIAAAITVGLTVRTIYGYSPSFLMGIALYIFTMTWQGSFNAVRQYIACAIAFAGHRYIIKRQFWRWAAVVAVATLFHVSALLLILLYWVPQRRLGVARGAVLMATAVAATLLYNYLGSAANIIKGEGVSTSSTFLEDVNPLRIAAAFAPVILYAALTDKSRVRPQDYFYVNLLFINALILLASFGSAYVARFAIYSGVFAAIAIPTIVNMPDKRTAAFFRLAILSFYAIFWYFETMKTPVLAHFRWVFDR